MKAVSDKILALIFLAATTFGGIVYSNAIDRIRTLEAHAEEDRRTILTLATHVEYIRKAVDRIDAKVSR